jgi:hypothetical protein
VAATEEYGTPESWKEKGLEWVGPVLCDTAGPFPSQGDYELCYTLSSNLGPDGAFVPLNGYTAALLVVMIQRSRNFHMPTKQREAQIKQRLFRERQQRIQETCDDLLDARPAFYDQPTSFASGPKNHKISTLWLPPGMSREEN